ncbi:MAG: hypothetical protein WC872_04020 [Candidatus Absconditabacterales bacterium]
MKIKLIGLILIFGFINNVFALQIPGGDNIILNENPNQVLDTNGINDPIRDGAYKIVNAEDGKNKLEGIVSVDNQIGAHEMAKNKTLNLVKNIINYFLGLLALITLIYLIYHGVLILTAAGDDAQYKTGIKSVKYAVIALGGIGLSRFIISFVFRLLNLVVVTK